MKTKGYLSTALLVTIAALLLTSSIPLVLAPKILTCPTGTIEVTQGFTFTLTHEFEWDEAASGFYSVALYWWYHGQDDNHFTVVENKAYFENLDPIECTRSELDNGDLISMTLRNTIADSRNGHFFVELTLRAQGPLGTDHLVMDNHPIYYTKLRCNETATRENTPSPVAIKVNAAVENVDVSVSPDLRHGWTGDNLAYDVVVVNTGNVPDSYVLTLSEDAGWPHGILGDPVDNITPSVADTYVISGKPAENGYADNYNMYVGRENFTGYDQGIERAFLRFDISSIPSGTVVTDAKLYLMGTYGPSHAGATATQYPDNMWIEVWSIDNDAWWDNENVNWNSQPALGTCLDNKYIVASAWVGTYKWWSWDVTSFVASQYAGDKKVSLGLTSTIEEDLVTSENNRTWFNTRDTATAGRRPALVVTTMPNTGELDPGENWTGQIWVVVGGSPCDTDNLTVTATSTRDNTVSDSDTVQAHHAVAGVDENIEPAHREAWPGVIDFTVTVQNTGQASDSFNLAASSASFWPVSLDAAVLGPIAPWGTASTTLHVTLWDNVPVCTTDTITVTATSQHDGTVSDVDTCTLHHKTHLRSVEIEILPEDREAHASIVDRLINPSIRYDPVTFTVKVTNSGGLDDLYRFVLSDNEHPDWGLKIDPAELFIPAQDTEYAALSVTVPENVWGCTWDNIKIEVIGKLANEPELTDNARAEDWCQVHAEVIHGVAIEVLPDNIEPQTGSPGSPIVWLVVIKNIGNTPNTFELGDLSDEPFDWSLSLSPPVPGWTLDPGKKATAYLTLDIPDSAKTCDWDNIHIRIQKVGLSMYYDETTVRVHVLEPGPRIPQQVIEIAVEAQVVAIDVWPTQWDVGILDEAEDNTTGPTYFTLRNTGNVDEKIFAKGTDAQSMPGEPVTTWTLAGAIGVDDYMLELLTPAPLTLTTGPQVAWPLITPGTEVPFGLTIYSPSVITTPARMWARVVLTAVEA